jgi:hypothetical protein
MTEDISEVYDDVQIREWAKNIRQIKINELQTKIRQHEDSWKNFIRQVGESLRYETEPEYQNIINKLKDKINILETK